MSLVYNRDMNFSGTSKIASGKSTEPDTVVMTMSANYNASGVSFQKYIDNLELYAANKDTVDADYAQFETNVFETVGVSTATDETESK